MIFLTQETGFLKPIAWVLGKIMEGLFHLLKMIMGLFNLDNLPYIIGFCVILFTIVVKLILLPLTVKQQRFSKLSNMMNPEIQAIQAKYKDKKDNESVMKMNAETKAVYEKYGTSPTGGCLTMLIQLPIMFALYRVIYKIPGYIKYIGDMYRGIADKVMGVEGYAQKLVDLNLASKVENVDTANELIDRMYTFSNAQWATLKENFSVVADNFSASIEKLSDMTGFFGISLTQAPGWRWSWALLIPLLAGVTQWLSAKLMESKNKAQMNNQQQGMGNSMKVMNTVMPIMSAFFCITFPACIGLYWIASSVVQIVQQLIINAKMDKIDVEEMVQHNIDKMNAKRAKKGLPPKKITNTASAYAEQVKKQEERDARKGEREEQIKKSTDYYNSSAKPGSLASKANMVKMYNEKNNKKND
ncbi:MAG: YidC/Oxa1 family membrane protein insertase [Butyrivibrio sp.]|nr:YidC/Oxa1 family membrane protein insertase [Butyrivibrio sp.]